MYFVFNVRIIKGSDSNQRTTNKNKVFVVYDPHSLSNVITQGKKSVCLNIFSSLRNFIFFGITSEQFYNLGFLMNYMGTKWQNIDDSKVP